MTTFQAIALLFTAIWLALVAVRFRRSTPFLIGGLALVALYAAGAVAYGAVTLEALGLGVPESWPMTVAWAAGWTALMFAYSPIADWLASRWFAKPPSLGAFRVLQKSTVKLVGGIVVAWVLGGFLEELLFRGIVLRAIEAELTPWAGAPIAAAAGIIVAALGAGIAHFYQGPRAMAIITQLSVLFGVLFVVSGHNLWAVILCHGFYDTIAFIRFATKKSKYSDLDSPQAPT
jgi:membrane protease YdiL (CAAX protease family)